jgi:hypothetical protein
MNTGRYRNQVKSAEAMLPRSATIARSAFQRSGNDGPKCAKFS